MIFLVWNEKGGVGKSAIAQALSGYIAEQGDQVILVDADPQRTSAAWAEDRGHNNWQGKAIGIVEMSGDLRVGLRDLSNSKHVVVDCGGADSKAARYALSVADVVIIPFRAKRRDLKVAVNVADIVESAKIVNPPLKVFSVITQAPTLPSQGYRIMDAKIFLGENGLNPLDHITRNVNGWDDAEESGLTVFEYKNDTKARDDAKALFDELFEKVYGGK